MDGYQWSIEEVDFWQWECWESYGRRKRLLYMGDGGIFLRELG